MRKLGIILAVMIAATLGYSGTASAQQAELCDQVIGGIADGAAESPIDDTTAGLQDDCNESFTEQKVNVNETLCGLQSDVGETLDPALGDVVDQVHGGVHEAEKALEDGGLPDIVDADHPCAADEDPPEGDDDDDTNGDDDDTQVEAVQRSNATADGGLPRTGGELFAGAGFGLMSLGALVRRFLP